MIFFFFIVCWNMNKMRCCHAWYACERNVTKVALVNTRALLVDAQKNAYAIGAFNIENMEMTLAVVEAAEELGVPVILQTTPATVRYGGLSMFYAMAQAAARGARVPVALHLDHADSFSLAAQAIRGGYTSVMIDGALLTLAENILLTKKVVEMAAPNLIPVEAALGNAGREAHYTDPKEALQFVEQTRIDSLAVAIETTDGPYTSTTPEPDISRLRQIRRMISIPLVLDDASALSDEQIRKYIQAGICKVNFSAALHRAYSDAIRELLREKPETRDPKIYSARGQEKVIDIVKNRIRVCSGIA